MGDACRPAGAARCRVGAARRPVGAARCPPGAVRCPPWAARCSPGAARCPVASRPVRGGHPPFQAAGAVCPAVYQRVGLSSREGYVQEGGADASVAGSAGALRSLSFFFGWAVSLVRVNKWSAFARVTYPCNSQSLSGGPLETDRQTTLHSQYTNI